MIRVLSDLYNFFFPAICIITDSKIPKYNSNPFILDEVINNLDRPSKHELYLLQSKLDSNNIFSSYATKGKNNVNQILHYIKYKGFSKLGLFFGEFISHELIKGFPDIKTKYNFICPVPLHKAKLRERGYNQSEFIVRGLNNTLRTEYYPDLIIRSRYTKSQTTLPYPERIANVKDAFILNPKYTDAVRKKRVILVDDVVTSGSTINEVIRVLKGGGVTNIFTVTLAMATGE